jgi:hypothetical protein
MNTRLIVRNNCKKFSISIKDQRFYALQQVERYFDSRLVCFFIWGNQMIKGQRTNKKLLFNIIWSGPCSSLGRYGYGYEY